MIEQAPQWLKDFARNRSGTRATPAFTGAGSAFGPRPPWLPAARGIARSMGEPAAIADITAALAAIPNSAPPLERERGWDDWNRIGMAVWASCEGSQEGLAAFEAWGQRSRKWSEGAADERWRAYAGCPPVSIGFGSLVFEARAVAGEGWAPPSRAAVETQPREEVMPFVPESGKSNRSDTSPLPDALAGGNLLQVNGNHALPEQLTRDTSGNPLIKLNERYSVIGDIGGKCLVLSWVNSKVDETVKVPSFQTFKSFSERYASQYVSIKSLARDGSTVEEPKQLGNYWLKWTGRKSFEGLDLVPGGPAQLQGNVLNLWTGFGVEPVAGHWDRMKEHIYHVLASGDANLARYIFHFAAWAIQHPGERAEVALVFRGGKGSGKGTFANALRAIFGQHGLQIFNSKHLVGAFNGHLRNCLLLFADEAFWAGDKQGESVLKGMLTEPALMIEQKGIDAAPWKNRLHVIMAANTDWVVPASHDERRYAMFDVAGDWIGDREYFRILHGEIQNGGLAAMLWDLQRVELGKWHPRDIMKTEALWRQKERSLKPIEAWWAAFLDDGILPNTIATKPNHIPAIVLLNMVREFAPRAEINPTVLGRFLTDRLADRLHRDNGNAWQMPDLSKARAEWEKRYGGWNWKHDYAEWKRIS